jgi:hypothetical protein
MSADVSASEVCTPEEDARVEDRIDHIHDWLSLRHTYETLKICDSGGTSERLNDVVIGLLAEHWPRALPDYAMVAKDPGFRTFVLIHISATGDLNELKKIHQNAEALCLKGQEAICKLFADKAKLAIDELASAGIE